ncbi:molybdenum cofactor guanylyltransferase, partial [Actinoallomurus acaciae]
VLVDADGHPQWLAGIWRTADLAGALAAYRSASLRGLMDPLAPRLVRAPEGESPWYDCDTPSDIAAASRMIGENRA